MKRLSALLGLCLLGAAPSALEIRGLRHPALSPDGRRIAFDWHGDIWSCPTEGGQAERLTDDPADEQKPCWSPDGTKIAFSSDKAGNRDLFVLDLGSKEARQLTYHSSDDDTPAWSPDGKWIAFQSNRDSNLDLPLNNNVWDLWKTPADGGTATRITRFRGENPAWSPDGKWIIYDRYSSGYADGEHNLFVIASDGSGVPREIASGGEDSRHPVVKGSQVYFAHEANGLKLSSSHRNVWRTSITGGPLLQVTGHRDNEVTWPSATPKSDVLVYEHDFDLYSVDLRKSLPEPRKLAITTGYQYDNPETLRTYTAGFRTPAWSPSGSRIAFVCRGQVWIASADGGDPKAITGDEDDHRDPAWTPDENGIVYVGGLPGAPAHVWVADVASGAVRKLTREEGNYRTPRLTADGRRLLVSRTRGESTELLLMDLDAGGSQQLATGGDGAPEYGTFSPDGKSIAFLLTQGNRTDVVVMSVEGRNRRVIPTEQSVKSGLAWSPDGTKLAWSQASQDGSRSVQVAEVESSQIQNVARGGLSPSWSPDGTMLVAEVDRGRAPEAQTLLIFDLRSSHKLTIDIKASRRVSRREDMLGVFLQVWASYAGNYYDPFFHGVDWTAAREKYRGLAGECRTKPELYDLINDMIRELHSSHIHLTPAPLKNSVVSGSLAADLASNEDGTLRVVRIEGGGPAEKAGLAEGEMIVGAQGSPLTPRTDLDRILTGDAGAGIPEIQLDVRSDAGAVRSVTLKGLERNALRELKYENRIAWRKKVTRERSGGRLAYHHIKLMVQPEVTRLKRALEEDCADAEGLVLDERDGMGGLAHRPVCSLLDSTAADRLNANPACATRNRNGATALDKYGQGPQGGRNSGKSWDRPVIMIQNEISRSDKEILPFTFRHLGIGYLVGMPTAGGVIGGNEWTMQDGSKIIVSVQGWFAADGRNLEGYGVPPDFRAAETHEDLIAGHDAPLEKAIEVLLAQMDGKIARLRKPGLEKKFEGQPGK
jgi:Tol biopolymer transport system component